MSEISWTKTALIEVESLPLTKMGEWELWLLENNIHPLEGFSQITRNAEDSEALDYRGVFKFRQGYRALAALKKILKVEEREGAWTDL